MTDPTNIPDFGQLAKPVNTFIEKISDAVGGVLKPWQMKRIATAEVESAKIRTIGQIEISELQSRAISRFLQEEADKQNVIEQIAYKALPYIQESAKPEEIQKDWLTNLFDKCRLTSDSELQEIWAKILSGEANTPGLYSKRTVNFLASMDKYDAQEFRKLCSVAWKMKDLTPIIFDPDHIFYDKIGLRFDSLKHMEDIGLLKVDVINSFIFTSLKKNVKFSYQGQNYDFTLQKDTDNEFPLGCVLLSKVGVELSRICGQDKIDGFEEFCIEEWKKLNVTVVASSKSMGPDKSKIESNDTTDAPAV